MTDYKIDLRQGGRRHGMTTALIDLAIMNARAGAYVQFWAPTWPRVEHAFRKAVDRLQITDQRDCHIGKPNNMPTIRFGTVGGRLEFRSLSTAENFGPTRSDVDFSVIDADNLGQMVAHDRREVRR